MSFAAQLRNLLAALEAEEAAQKSKDNVNTYTNHGDGFQNITGTKTNSGAYSGDGNTHHTSNNYGNGLAINNSDGNTHYTSNNYGNGPAINNSGNFHGHGNGGFLSGNFDASQRNYRI